MNEQITNESEANTEANTDIVPAFEESLFEQSRFEPLIDTGLEYIELGIDSFLKDGVLKDIPIVGSLVGVGKFMGRVHDYNSLNQTLNFIRAFNQHRDNKKVEKHRNKLRANPKLMEKELGHVLIIIDRNTDITKSIIEGKFYAAYINETIDWNEFCEMCAITERLFMSDIHTLKEAYDNNGVTDKMEKTYRHDRLSSIGLITAPESVGWIEIGSTAPNYISRITEIGEKYCSIAFQ